MGGTWGISGPTFLVGYLLLRLAPGAAGQQEEEARQSAEIDADGDVEGVEERRA